MDAAIHKWFGWWTAKDDTKVKTGPAKPRRTPVFIHDAITPCQDETLLLMLLRRSDRDDQP